jgi:alanyl-tRNA synthetase
MPETAIRTAAQIRQEFLDFFTEKYGHTFAPSSPVVPHDDPTLLFTNAGMNQFKDVFLGTGERPYKRAVNSQKCIRAGGKHNDLEDVGRDTYHHTFFEMLGNWSFGDYFKREAIQWAWELLTEVWGLDKDRLYVTVFEGDQHDGLDPDEEAEQLWKDVTDIDPSHISRWGKKDNFWEMGDTGPCGPCSEIHYDATPDKSGGTLVNRDDPMVIEIWNLVFIQFNRDSRGKLTPLPAKHVDTGMGFERITRVLQDKTSNYDTDIWTPIFKAIQETTRARAYRGSRDDSIDIAYRVIADHVRCLTIAITDGATPSNEGRGYVLRRILRRAVRHARQTMGTDKPVLCELVPSVVDSLGEAFPELKQNPQRVADVIRQEEEAFLRTIDRGIELFEAACGLARNGTLSAADAFKLHDTYGFPIDLTCVMAEERGMKVDVEGFEKLMSEAREKSRAGTTHEETITLTPSAIDHLKKAGIKPTKDEYKYGNRPVTARVAAIWNGSDFDNTASINRRVALILDKTSFYAESGGQVGDRGELATQYEAGFGVSESHSPTTFEVEDTQSVGDYILHIGRITEGKLTVGDVVDARVEREHRDPTRANHTATHLLNFALREVVAPDVDQKGSLVAPDRLRFDFSCAKAMTIEQIEQVEHIVNEKINENLIVYADVVPLDLARNITGLRAVFGEKYPDPVRVVSIGAPINEIVKDVENEKWRQFSIEFCGGTHLDDTAQAKHFVIVKEEALAAGVRRITAYTGAAARAADIAGRELLARIGQAKGKVEAELIAEFDAISSLAEQISIGAVLRQKIHESLGEMREMVKRFRKKAQAGSREKVVEQARKIAEAHGQDARATEVIVEQIDGADKDTILAAMDVIKAKCPDSAILLASPDHEDGKVMIVAAVPQPLIKAGLKAGDWVREVAKACGGGGGGRPDMAQAGGKDPSKTGYALQIACEYADNHT